MKIQTIYTAILALALSACSIMDERQNAEVAAEVNGQRLTFTQLDQVTASVPREDSARAADAYIRQWAEQVLLYDKAKDRADAGLEALVEDYRRSLYVHAYEQKMLSRNCPKEWPDSLIESVYEKNKSRLRLRENILKGVLVVVPERAPKQEYLKKWLSQPLNDKTMDKIDKYALQYATGYEFFADEWRSANQILLRLPVETDVLTEKMHSQKQIVVTDSTSVYILQIKDKRMAGDIMPKDYARGEIEQLLISQWQVKYLKQERQHIYDDAVRFNKIKRYERYHENP